MPDRIHRRAATTPAAAVYAVVVTVVSNTNRLNTKPHSAATA